LSQVLEGIVGPARAKRRGPIVRTSSVVGRPVVATAKPAARGVRCARPGGIARIVRDWLPS